MTREAEGSISDWEITFSRNDKYLVDNNIDGY